MNANISAASIGVHDVLALIERELRLTGAPPSNLVIEVTETALMRDMEAGAAFARGLADLGCSLALDDFGTGYGGLTYLKRFPAVHLKIDIDFVRGLCESTANQHLVKAIVNLAKAFGQTTIAEGVEDAATLSLLAEYGVNYAQGYHIGRPAALGDDVCCRARSRGVNCASSARECSPRRSGAEGGDASRPAQATIACCIAQSAAAARVDTPIFVYTCWMWWSAVFGEM